MIGLDSYSRQVFIYLDPILIYISLWIDCLFESRKIAVFPLAFIAGWLQGHWWGFISRNYVVWPTFLLMNVFIALKGSHFWFLLVRPQLEYAAPIWNPHHQTEINRIEKAQRTAARWACRRWSNQSHVEEMLDELQWPELQERRQQASFTFCKIHNNLVTIDKNRW